VDALPCRGGVGERSLKGGWNRGGHSRGYPCTNAGAVPFGGRLELLRSDRFAAFQTAPSSRNWPQRR